MLIRITVLMCFALCAACQRAPESIILGEWHQRRLDPVDHVTYLTDHVTYRPDHTYIRRFEDPRRGVTDDTGRWRIEDGQIICDDGTHGESRGDILRLTPDQLQIKPPDGVIADYRR